MQMEASIDKDENLKVIKEYIAKAADDKSELVAFPEFIMCHTPSSQTPQQLADVAETLDGNFVGEVADMARSRSVQVVGTIYEKSDRNDRVYDTAFLLDRGGRMVSSYRKVHLYDALGFYESDKMMPGSHMPRPAQSSAGVVGMMICYDLRFPEMARSLALAGSQILVAPSAWVRGQAKEEHWITINKTRALENGCYVIAPDQVGRIYCGRSLVVDPYGSVLVDMGAKQGLASVDISLERLEQIRQGLPLLQSRKPDIYRESEPHLL